MIRGRFMAAFDHAGQTGVTVKPPPGTPPSLTGHIVRVTPTAGCCCARWQLRRSAAGYEQLYPNAGDPWRARTLYLATLPRSVVLSHWQEIFGSAPDAGQVPPGVPDAQVTTTIDVRSWTVQKWTAMCAHESESERGAGAAMFAGLPDRQRDRLLGTEWYIRRDLTTTGPGDDL